MEGTFWSLVPPLLTIILAVWTKEVILSLFIGVYLGCLMLTGWNPLYSLVKLFQLICDPYGENAGTPTPDNPWQGLADPEDIYSGYAYDSGVFTNPENMQILILVTLLGGLIGLFIKTGGSQAFGDMLQKKVKTKTGAQLITWGIGLIIFFDDYFNAMTNGNVMRPVTDRYNISREKLSYIVDSTSVGICLISPISSWVAFLAGLIGTEFAKNPEYADENSFISFIKTIPYNYYAILSIVMVLIVILLKLDYGPMAKAERRAAETGKVCEATFGSTGDDDDEEGDFDSIKPSKNGNVAIFIIPIVLLICLALVLILWTGGFFDWNKGNLIGAVNDMDGMKALITAIAITTVIVVIWAAIARIVNPLAAVSAWVTGCKSMMYVILLLALAWALGDICDQLDTAGFLTASLGALPKAGIILLIFAIACVLTFTTGAAFATYPIMIPIAIPLAFATGVSPYAMIAAVIGGGGFGNHTSPLADTCILSSSSSNVRHTDHVKTQIPYSTLCAVSAAVGYIFSGIMGDNFLVPLLVTFGVFFVGVIILSKLFGGGKASATKIEE